MTHEVAKVLAQSLKPMHANSLITVLAGLVKTATTTARDNRPVKLPVLFGQYSNPIQVESKDLIPSSEQRSIIYFEGSDSSITQFYNDKSKMRSNVRLICWYNSEKYDLIEQSSIAISLLSNILALLPNAKKLSKDILGLEITPGTVYDSTARLFSQYSYKEEYAQFLLPPYYAFGIDIQVTYQLNHSCHAAITPTDSTGCC